MSHARPPHPVVWTVLYLPFGALSGFIQVALTFLATKNGLSISEGALLNGAGMLTQWLKWIWAPVVDVTSTPRRWYVASTSLSALGIFAMCVVPLGPKTLPLLLAVIAISSLINSVVGMAVEAIMSATTPPEEVGRVSAWFQAGNLGGAGLGGALGLLLVTHLPAWLAGLVLAACFLACCAALLATPPFERAKHASPKEAVRSVLRDLVVMLKTKGGLSAAILCVLPIGTGAAQVVLTQAKVAAHWGASEKEVELMQGLSSGIVTTVGCFVGGYLCQRMRPRFAYALFGVVMSVVAALMAAVPASVGSYVGFSMAYAFATGLCYAAFTAFVLEAMGHGSGATKYNVFASLSNFPIWWLGLVLGVAADDLGPRAMLLTEAAFGVLGVVLFWGAAARVRRSKLAEG